MVPTNVWRQFTWNATAFLTRYGVASGGTGWNTNVLSAESPVGTVTYDYSGFVATATAGSVTTGYGTISTSIPLL